MVVAIDGPSGVGKSSLAKKAAAELSLFFINSGNFYRAITKLVLDQKMDPENSSEVISAAKSAQFDIKNEHLFCNELDVENSLHTDAIDTYVAEHSAIKEVRLVVNEQLRKISENIDIISEGRDITTVVFPDADFKFYLDASLDIRAKRRYDQQISDLPLSDIESNLAKRDKVDTSKEFGKLTIARDAYYIDTSHLTLDEVYEKVLQKIKQNGKNMQESRKVISEKETDKMS
ncbi:MAG: (d)CMP kinase, partial [Spirochaetia bacterium]|nr:(d)CMP kinase [Spirochaetia bacterium]